MAKYATGKYAKAISDRSGMEFPYKEMVREWNGAFVHVSEFEPKQPQLEPKPMNGDSISLQVGQLFLYLLCVPHFTALPSISVYIGVSGSETSVYNCICSSCSGQAHCLIPNILQIKFFNFFIMPLM